MKTSEKIAGISLLTFSLIGLISLFLIPININISKILIFIDTYILCLILVPIAIFGLIRMVGYVFFNKNGWI